MRISGSALTAQRLRMDVVAGNIANADTTRTNGQRAPYERQEVVFQPLVDGATASPGEGLQVSAIVRDPAPARQVYDPTHPDADPQTGLVAYPNVDTTTEMTDLLSASRADQAGADFGSMLKDAIGSLSSLGAQADASSLKLATGEPVDIHEVMLNTEQASLGFEVALQVRNKLVDAYTEMMRMSI